MKLCLSEDLIASICLKILASWSVIAFLRSKILASWSVIVFLCLMILASSSVSLGVEVGALYEFSFYVFFSSRMLLKCWFSLFVWWRNLIEYSSNWNWLNSVHRIAHSQEISHRICVRACTMKSILEILLGHKNASYTSQNQNFPTKATLDDAK